MSFIKNFLAEKKSIFLKWFFAYLIVVLVIFIMITAVVYRFVLENVKEEIEASNLRLVEHAAESVDARLKEFDVYSHRMTSDSKFSKQNLGKSAYDNYECVLEMKKYKAINNFMDDVGVFYSDIPEKVFCESGIYDTDIFFNEIYRTSGYDEKAFSEDLKELKMPVMKPFKQNESGIAAEDKKISFYLYPIKDINKTIGCVIFVISDESFYQLIKGAVLNGDCRFVARSKSGSLIFDTADISAEAGKLSDADLMPAESGITYMKSGGKNLSLCCVISDYNGWSYSLLMDRNDFLGRMIVMRNVFLLSELFIFFMVLGLIWYFTYKNYRPVKELVSIMPGYKNGNELSYAINTMMRLFDEKRQYEKIISRGIQVERQLLLCRLLLADGDEKSVREKLADKNVSFGYPFNIVYIFSLYGYAIDENITFAFINVAEEYAEEYGHGYGVKLLDNNTIALIVNTEDADVKNSASLAEKASSLFKTEFDIDVLYGISDVISSDKNLNMAYNQAKNVLLNRLSFGNVPSDLSDSLKKMKDRDYLYFIDSEQNIIEAVKNADAETTEQIIDGILLSLRKMSATPQQISDIYGGMLISLVKMLSETNLKDMTYKVIELFSIRSDVDAEEFADMFKEYAAEICSEFKQRKETTNSDMINKLTEYIEMHYNDNALSLKTFETVFKKNGSYLSRYFKEKTGVSLMKYIDNIRHEKVKQLLCETDLRLGEIAEKVGYIEANSMIRKFKKRENITPNQYRRLMNKCPGGNEYEEN